MKCVFFVTFTFRKYKNNSKFKIYLDDRLVDDVVLSKEIDFLEESGENFIDHQYDFLKSTRLPKDIEAEKTLQKIHNNEYPQGTDATKKLYRESTAYYFPNKVFTYLLDINEKSKNINLEFDLHDNNHTNGFMNRSAHIVLRYAGLVSETLWCMSDNQLDELYNRSTDSFKNPKFRFVNADKHTWYRSPRHEFDAPVVHDFSVIENDVAITKDNLLRKLGGKIRVKIPIVKKHNCFILRNHGQNIKGLLRPHPYFLWLKKQINKNV